MLKKFVAGAFTALLMSGLAPTAQAISQGEFIQNSQGGCTAGYIDRVANKMFTAAHCVAYVGEPIRDARGVEIGVVESTGNTGAFYQGLNDWATVRLHAGQAGVNAISGDVRASMKLGDTVCVHSRLQGKVTCAPVIVDNGTSVFIAALPGATIPGDSGGAAFSPGKGLVGMVSGTMPTSTIVTRHPDVGSAPAPVWASSMPTVPIPTLPNFSLDGLSSF